jgi:hypothetical protein
VTPVYVCSRGRPTSRVIADLVEGPRECLVFVEPGEEDEYTAVYDPPLRVLPKAGRGLAYTRQAALDHARDQGVEWYWLLDDDITRWYRREGTKLHPVTLHEALDQAEAEIGDRTGVGQFSVEYQQLAWTAKRPVVTGYCDVAVCIHPDPLVDYRPETGVKVDRDYTLQVLASGLKALRVTTVAFAAPKNGSNKGGLQEEYASGVEARDSQVFASLWPGICTPTTKKDGRRDVRVDWRYFEKRPR